MGLVAVAGAVVGLAGNVMGGNAKKRAAYDEASQAELDARIRAQNIRKLAARTRGEARAGYAASGVMVDEGSALLTDADITRQSELDAFYTIFSGNKRAQSLRRQGNAEQLGGWLQGAGSVLGAFSQGG